MNYYTDLPLNRKVEMAFVFFLRAEQAKGTILQGLTIESGHTVEEPLQPYLSVSASNFRTDEEMPDEVPIKTGELVFHLKTHADDSDRLDADRWLYQIETLLSCPQEILEKLNIPADGSPDSRAVRELYVYGVHQTDSPETTEENTWIDQRVCEVIAQGWDPDTL